MDLNSLLKDMGLVDAFSTALNQVDLDVSAGECSESCRGGCSSSCHDGCSGGKKGG